MTKIVIAVFDGLQPSQINSLDTPNLFNLSGEGSFFENHHPVFPSVTRVNAASMVTGVNPGKHWLAGNTFVARDYDDSNVMPALNDQLSKIRNSGLDVLGVPTLQEIISSKNMNYVAIGVGTSGNAYVHNPLADRYGGATIHPEFTIPSSLSGELEDLFGTWPSEQLPNTPRYRKAVDIFTEYILETVNPEVGLIWSSEPDKSQHSFGVGSDEAKLALQEADYEFGKVIKYLNNSPKHQNFDLMILSDHGYSTISEVVDVESILKSSELESANEWLVAQNGGSVLFYLKNPDEVFLVSELIEWLSGQIWCGALCSSDRLGEIPGAISSSLIMNEGKRSPDLIMSFNWDSSDNLHGYSGQVYSTGGSVGLGQHGSMSRHEMNNTLICRGPSFLEGEKILSPTGNIDILPTILYILGQEIPDQVEGRILEESFKGSDNEIISETEIYEASLSTEFGTYSQEITISAVGQSRYVDEGKSWLKK